MYLQVMVKLLFGMLTCLQAPILANNQLTRLTMSAAHKTYSAYFLKLLRPHGRHFMEPIIFQNLKSSGALKPPRGCRGGIKVKQRITTERRQL